MNTFGYNELMAAYGRATSELADLKLGNGRQLHQERFTAACAAMQGMLAYSAMDANGNWQNNSNPSAVAEWAVKYADALLKQLGEQPNG